MPDIFVNTKTETKKQETENTNPILKEVDQEPGIFSAYCPSPTGIHFANQEKSEKLILFLRRHFITNFVWIFYTFIFLLIPFIFLFLPNLIPFSISSQYIFILVSFYYILVFNFAFTKFMVWFYHVGIVTQKRLLDLDIDNILHYHLSETNIEDVVDVSYTQKGFFQSFFDYGDVPIQTEALKANFEFEQTPHPATVADLVTDLRPQVKGAKRNVT